MNTPAGDISEGSLIETAPCGPLREAFESDPILIARTLEVYKPQCRYLLSVHLFREGTSISGVCRFAIPESFYINDTGHFNAVEFNICYNQMFYCVVARVIRDALHPALSHWTMGDYWNAQLQNIFIASFASNFRSPMKCRSFQGEIKLLSIRERRGVVWIDTACRYWDDEKGKCEGEVLIAICNPPARPTP